MKIDFAVKTGIVLWTISFFILPIIHYFFHELPGWVWLILIPPIGFAVAYSSFLRWLLCS